MGVRHGRCAVVRRLHGDRPGYRIRGTRCLPALLGIAEAANWPGATRIVARTFEPAQRSLANGFFTSGTSIGALIAPALIFAITSALGWRSSFFVLGLAGVLWFVLWTLSTGSPKLDRVWHEAPRESNEPKEKLVQIVGQIVKSPRFLPV